jgi:hypothetical protein
MNYHGFESYSYSVMLLGLGYRPERSLPALDHIDHQNAMTAFCRIKDQANLLCNDLPSQYEYLAAMRSKSVR